MTSIYWLEQTEAAVPLDDHWLSPREILHLERLPLPKRRTDWRLGRWTAKHAIAQCLDTLDVRLDEIEVRAARCGAPEVFVARDFATVCISLSHSCGRAMCTVANLQAALGCDLEQVEPRSNAFVTDYFTSEEQELVAHASAFDRPWLATLIWSAKESAMKALHEGLRLDTRCVSVRLFELSAIPEHWHPLQVDYSCQIFHGWWQRNGNFIRAVVCSPRPALPTPLNPLLSVGQGVAKHRLGVSYSR